MKNKALVTGAYGFIGRNISRHLSENNWSVSGIGHGSWSKNEWESWGLKHWHTCDITIDSLIKYANNPDLIIHCAGSGSVYYSMSHPLQDYQRTADTTANVLEFIRLYSESCKLVYPSSAAVYGNAKSLPIPESAELQPISPYGVHKVIAEQICKSYAEHFDIHIAIVRLFSVYGSGLKKQLLWDACNKIRDGDLIFFGTGNEIRDWLHINDVVTLLSCAGKYASHFCPVVNGATGSGIKVSDIIREAMKGFGVNEEPQFSSIPRTGDPLGYIGDITRANNWGWEPQINWKIGVQDYVRWYKREVL